MFIAYDRKNGVEYAKLLTSHRKGKKTTKDYINLGRVLDKDAGIYQNRERGVFTYDLKDNTYGRPSASFLLPSPHVREKLILDFGDIFLLNTFIQSSGLVTAINNIGYGNLDTLYAMLCYYILCNLSNCHANDWWEGSYARILFPNANLTSQRISEFLLDIGAEEALRGFFGRYLAIIGATKSFTNILIDSTGLPNNVHFPMTAISNHNGEISNEVRLIYVSQQETGLPIYFRYCPGNVVDVSTLVRTVRELQASGVNTKLAILDAGFYSDQNLLDLYNAKISFVIRLKQNTKIYKKLVADCLPIIVNEENICEHNSRYVYIKRVECQLVQGFKAYAYVGLDLDRKSSEERKLCARAKADKLSPRDVHERLSRQGIFVLVSSKRLKSDEILPVYYTRQQIEQVFDIGKNYANIVPLRIQGEGTFRGHLLLTFIATVIFKMLQNKLIDTAYNPMSLFLNMKNQKCKVYADRIITSEAFKKANDCYKLFDIKCPVVIPR
ncbi:MAG: transposase [Christensenellaceae bacterium]|nr:transposase [Christensenellaceae bacterium]